MDLNIVDQIASTFSALPDCRKPGNNQKYAVADAALSAFSVFFTQSPSFLDYQRRMQKLHNRNNAQSIFGVHQIPSTSQIGKLLDPIALETLYPLLAAAIRTGLSGLLHQPWRHFAGGVGWHRFVQFGKDFLPLLHTANAEKWQNLTHRGHASHRRTRTKPRNTVAA